MPLDSSRQDDGTDQAPASPTGPWTLYGGASAAPAAPAQGPWSMFQPANPPRSALTPAKTDVLPPDEGDQPGFLSTVAQAAVRGAVEGGTSALQAPTAFRDRAPTVPTRAPGQQTLSGLVTGAASQQPQDTVSRVLETPLSQGWTSPTWWAAHIAHGAAASAPSLALGAAGVAAGEAVAPEGGGLIGGAAGFGLGSMIQEIAPAYQQARASGLDHDAAVTRAMEQTGIAGAFGAVMGLAPGVSAFGKTLEGELKRPISDALLQIFGVQPGLGAGQQVAQGAVSGQMPTAGELATGYAENVGLGAALTAGHGAVRAFAGDRTAAPSAESPAPAVPRVRTPEEIENEDGVGPDQAARVAAAEAANQPAAAAAATVPVERADQAARDSLAQTAANVSRVSPPLVTPEARNAPPNAPEATPAAEEGAPAPAAARGQGAAAQAPAVEPPLAQPRGIRSIDQIMREDGVSARAAGQVQMNEIAAVGRPITDAERAARIAGIPAERAAPVAAPEPPPPLASAQGEDLLAYLVRKGGITPTGETRAMDAHSTRPGLVRKAGMAPDYMREAMQEGGFFTGVENPTITDAYDLLDSALRGQKVYGNNQRVIDTGARSETDELHQQAAREEIRMTADEHGLALSPDEIEAAALAHRGGQSPVAAIMSARLGETGTATPRAAVPDAGPAIEDIPFGRRLPQPPGGGAPLFGEAPREQAPRPEAEPTIRNDPRQQGLFPTGGEAVQAQAARDQAGRGALTPKGQQQAADQGLFAPRTDKDQQPLFGRGEGEQQAHPEAVQAAVEAARTITGGKARIEAYDAAHDVFNVRFPDGHTEQVFGYTLGRLIRAAIEPGRTAWNLNHESVHALEALGVFKRGEMKTLEAAAKRGDWITQHRIAERYPDQTPQQQLREAIAEQFARYSTEPRTTPPIIQRMGEKIADFFERMRNLLALRGFRSADSVFGKMESGKIGAREPGVAAPTMEQSMAAAQRFEAAQGRREPEPQFGRDQEQTPEFKKWFAGSKVVDAAGKPLVVYHGTASTFDAFDPAHVGKVFGADKEGFFFTNNIGDSDVSSANSYARRAAAGKGDGANVVPAYVSLKNPLIFDDVRGDGFDGRGAVAYLEGRLGTADTIAEAKSEGHDGIILIDRSMHLAPSGEPEKIVIAFRPEQIKSATGNRGTFDPNDPRIAFGRRDQERELPGLASARETMGVAKKAADEVKQIFAPTSRGPQAKEAEHMIRGSAAERARANAQSTDALEKFGHMVGRLPEAEQLAITDRRENGEAQPTSALNKVIDGLRAEQGKWAQKVRSLGPQYLQQLRENYMGHIWANYPEWKAGIDAKEQEAQARGEGIAQGQARGKAPLKGSGAFLKQRTFDTQREGMEAGLIPVTTNPIEMQLLKLYEMQRFYHGVKLAEDIKASGMAHYVPAGDEGAARASGWVQLNDPAFQPRVVQGQGRQEFGNWWAPEQVARVFNNYVSPGLAGRSSIYDAVRGAGNALNSAQLSFSGFHATFIAFDTMMSRMGLGLQQLSRGEPIRGIGTMAKALNPATVVSTVMKGAALRDAYLHPENATPQMRKLVQALVAGGGRIKMDPFYQSTAAGSFVKSMGDLKNPTGMLHDAWQMAKDTPVAAPMRIVGRLLDTLNQPLMGIMVPRAKLGVFSDLASDFMRRNPDATPEETAAAMTKAWDSVDNRMGQLVYDNLFWNKTMKDLAFITTRSVGWNLGSVREIAGGGVDAAKAVADMARGKRPELTSRMAYTIAMPIITGLYGAILNYAMTGQGPQSLLDYFYPRTGALDASGAPARTTMPGYIKDVMAFKNDPLGTIGNKTQPLIETGIELAKNRDYYGGIINMPGVDNPVVSYGDYLLNQMIPFSLRGAMKTHEEGAPMLSQALNFFGIQPAPQSITSPERGEAYQQRQDIRAFRARQKENAKRRITIGAPP